MAGEDWEEEDEARAGQFTALENPKTLPVNYLKSHPPFATT